MRLVLSVALLLALASCTGAPPMEKIDTASAVVAGTSADPFADPLADPATDLAADPLAPDTNPQTQVVIDNNNPEISDTQDFAALTEKETIASDKARLKAQREQFVAIAPTALPTRRAGANVAEYALKSTNKLGEKIYRRSAFSRMGASGRSCSQFKLPDDAQASFLSKGGPQRDPGNLDPDGDGFACDWSPETYRRLVQQ